MGLIITIMLGLVSYIGNRIIDGQDKMNETLTTILISQSDLNRRVTTLEASDETNATRWKDHDEFTRQFFENYDLKLKK